MKNQNNNCLNGILEPVCIPLWLAQVVLTCVLIHNFETVPNSKRLQTTTEM